MAQAMTGEERFYVGATTDLDQLRDDLVGSAEVEQFSEPDEQGSCVVLVRGSLRHRDGLLRRLGPNAQETADRMEAEKAWKEAVVKPRGAPYEA